MELANIFAIINGRPLFLMTCSVTEAKQVARILRDHHGHEIKLKRSNDSVTLGTGRNRQGRVNFCLSLINQYVSDSSVVMTADFNGHTVAVRTNAAGLFCI